MNDIKSSEQNPEVKRFNRWAATYDNSIMQRLYFNRVHSKMISLIVDTGFKAPPATIIDIGCGTGRLLRALSDVFPETVMIGIDPAPNMVSEAKRLNPAAQFHIASAESLPFPGQSADIIFSSLSFHHWTDQAKGLQEIQRVLKPGGILCLADHTIIIARLVGEKVINQAQIGKIINDSGLTVFNQYKMKMHFVLITLAEKNI